MLPTQPTYTSTILHVLAQGIVWTVPLFLLAFPKVGDLTISAVLGLLVAYINHTLTAV